MTIRDHSHKTRLDDEANFWFDGYVMNTSLVKSVPQGDFTDISVLMKGWETKVQTLVSQNRPIKFDTYPQPDIPLEIQNRLRQQGYYDLIVENDRWQHFLFPNPQ